MLNLPLSRNGTYGFLGSIIGPQWSDCPERLFRAGAAAAWGRMTETEAKFACTVRVTVKLRPGEYDELSRHVREIGSTMSAFFRKSALQAMKEVHPEQSGSILK